VKRLQDSSCFSFLFFGREREGEQKKYSGRRAVGRLAGEKRPSTMSVGKRSPSLIQS
jgi:hypothetical protein